MKRGGGREGEARENYDGEVINQVDVVLEFHFR